MNRTKSLDRSKNRPHKNDPPKPQPPTTSTKPVEHNFTPDEASNESRCKKFKTYMHNPVDGTYCGRTCWSWLAIIVYAILYFMFLCSYTMILLYISLLCIRMNDFTKGNYGGKYDLLTYADTGIGMTGTPTAEHDYPLIWYREGVPADYQKYISSLDALVQKDRTKRGTSELGPCSDAPYGYGDKPCVVVRINKQLTWNQKPLDPSSPKVLEAPEEVRKWMQNDRKKYWLHCSGYHPYDKEHIKSIKYYPDPPGFDSELFPVPMNGTSPMVAVQISGFTYGISLVIGCKLYYYHGVSELDFVLYVMPKNARLSSRTIYSSLTRPQETDNLEYFLKRNENVEPNIVARNA